MPEKHFIYRLPISKVDEIFLGLPVKDYIYASCSGTDLFRYLAEEAVTDMSIFLRSMEKERGCKMLLHCTPYAVPIPDRYFPVVVPSGTTLGTAHAFLWVDVSDVPLLWCDRPFPVLGNSLWECTAEA